MAARKWAEQRERELDRQAKRTACLTAALFSTGVIALPVCLAAAGHVFPGWLWVAFACVCWRICAHLVGAVRE